MNAETFPYDVFLSHSAKDQQAVPAPNVVRPLAERLRKDGLKVWPVPPKRLCVGGFNEWVLKPEVPLAHQMGEGSGVRAAKIEAGLEHSRVLACPAGTAPRRRMLCTPGAPSHANPSLLTNALSTINPRPSTSPRRFIPLRLDDAPIQGFLAQFHNIRRRVKDPDLLRRTCLGIGQESGIN